ncbi:hypothetical protein L0156_21445 [bacterium]|nr:hypothetical protein [bacterium]
MKNTTRRIFSKEVEDYVLANPDAPRTKKAPSTEPSSAGGSSPADAPSSKQTVKFESKHSFFGLINHVNQLGDALGLTNPKKRKRSVGIIVCFLILMAAVISAKPSSSSAQEERTSGIIGEERVPGQNDVEHFINDTSQKNQSLQIGNAAETGPPINNTRVETPAAPESETPALREVEQAPVAAEEPDPSSMLVYLHKVSDRGNPNTTSASLTGPGSYSGTETFIHGRLISKLEASGYGGSLAIGQLDDGTILYGSARIAPDIDRVYINFTEEQQTDGTRKNGRQYVIVDKQKTQGLPASCKDHGGSNVISKGLSIGFNALAAVASGRSTGAYSAQDAARDRLAGQIQREADYAEQTGRVRYCTADAGSEFYVVITGVSR